MVDLGRVTKLVFGAIAVVVVACQSGDAFAQGKKGCTNRLPAPGSIYKGQSVSIPNHCRCNGGTLVVTGGDNINYGSGQAQKGASRSYSCS